MMSDRTISRISKGIAAFWITAGVAIIVNSLRNGTGAFLWSGLFLAAGVITFSGKTLALWVNIISFRAVQYIAMLFLLFSFFQGGWRTVIPLVVLFLLIIAGGVCGELFFRDQKVAVYYSVPADKLPRITRTKGIYVGLFVSFFISLFAIFSAFLFKG